MKQNNLPWAEWFNKAKTVKTTEEFTELVNHLFRGEICHTYDSAVHAVSALALAGATLGAHIEGITGFQAGYIKFDFMHEWDRIGNEVGCQVVDFDHYLCYPQYVEKCPIKIISLKTWKRVQQVCADKLNALDTTTFHSYDGKQYAEEHHACYAVRQYWADVCNGIIPDCLLVTDDPKARSGIGYNRIDPICVNRPAHTLSDKERDWNDKSSPWFDKERVERRREEWRKESENQLSCGG